MTTLTVYGNGAGSVTGDQLNTFQQTCNNIAALRAFVGATGVQVAIRGLTTPGDGGAGEFYWVTGSSFTDDGVSTVVPSGSTTGAWVRLGYYVNVSSSGNTTLTLNASSTSVTASVVYAQVNVPKFSAGITTGATASWGVYNYTTASYGLLVTAANVVQIPVFATAGIVANDASGNLSTLAATGTGNAVLANAPTLSNPVVGTQASSDSSTKAASTAFVAAAVAGAASPWAITGGLPTSISGTSTSASVVVSACNCIDTTFSSTIASGALTFNVATGNAINGFAGGTSLTPSSTIHMYLCKGASGVGLYANTVFGMAAAAAPTGYNSFVRRIFSFTTTGAGAPIPYNAIEGPGGSLVCYLATQVLDVNSTTVPNASRQLYTLSVPTGLQVRWIGRYQGGGSGIAVMLTSPSETDAAPSNTAGTVPEYDTSGTGTGAPIALQRETWTNTSAQIGARATSGSGNLYLVTSGFGDPRRS